MKQDNTRDKINRAFSKLEAPDVLDSVLSELDGQKGTILMKKQNWQRSSAWIKRTVAIAAAFLLVLSAGAVGAQMYAVHRAVASTVSLDVNPSIEIRVNREEKVLAVEAKNEDAAKIIGEMDFKDSGLDVTVNALVGSMLRNGYLSEIANSILVSVESKDEARAAELQTKLMNEINAMLRSDSFDGAVLSQIVADDQDLRDLAKENSITTGKAALIREVLAAHPNYTFEALAQLSINELNLLRKPEASAEQKINSVGTASDKAYIGEDEAQRIAFEHANINKTAYYDYEIEFDYESGVLVYEIEFSAGGFDYDYDINAETGEIVKVQKDTDDDYHDDDDDDDRLAVNTPQTGTTDETYIGEEEAQRIAFEHANINKMVYYDYEIELDYEAGVRVYEIHFSAIGFDYEYDINAKTGEIVKVQKETDDDYRDDDDQDDIYDDDDDDRPAVNTQVPNTTAPTPQPSPAPTYITADAAKSAALAHAGVSADAVYDLECEFDEDDGVKLYEIEFKSNGTEYKYDISATDGSILEFETDRDD